MTPIPDWLWQRLKECEDLDTIILNRNEWAALAMWVKARYGWDRVGLPWPTDRLFDRRVMVGQPSFANAPTVFRSDYEWRP